MCQNSLNIINQRLNYPKAWIIIGLLNEFGHCGFKKDLKKAFEYYEQAALKENSFAFFCLGHLLDGTNEEGDIMKNEKEAFNLIKKSAELGDKFGTNRLGFLYFNGIGCGQDYAKAFHYFTRSSEMGLAKAFFNLGCCYENGNGVKTDNQKAFENYQKSAQRGHGDGLSGENDKLALKIFSYLAGKDIKLDHQIMKKVADMHYFGFDCECDFEKAQKLYEIIANEGDRSYLISVGICFSRKNNYKKAIECYNEYLQDAEKTNKDINKVLVYNKIGNAYLCHEQF